MARKAATASRDRCGGAGPVVGTGVPVKSSRAWALRSCSEAECSAAMSDPSGKGQDGGGGKTDKTLADFAAEYAKSNRSTCKGCLEKIEKVSLGVGVLTPRASGGPELYP